MSGDSSRRSCCSSGSALSPAPSSPGWPSPSPVCWGFLPVRDRLVREHGRQPHRPAATRAQPGAGRRRLGDGDVLRPEPRRGAPEEGGPGDAAGDRRDRGRPVLRARRDGHPGHDARARHATSSPAGSSQGGSTHHPAVRQARAVRERPDHRRTKAAGRSRTPTAASSRSCATPSGSRRADQGRDPRRTSTSPTSATAPTASRPPPGTTSAPPRPSSPSPRRPCSPGWCATRTTSTRSPTPRPPLNRRNLVLIADGHARNALAEGLPGRARDPHRAEDEQDAPRLLLLEVPVLLRLRRAAPAARPEPRQDPRPATAADRPAAG